MAFDCVGCVHLSDSYKTGIASHCEREFTEHDKGQWVDEHQPCPFKIVKLRISVEMERMIWEIGKGLEDLVKEQERNGPYDSEEMQLRTEMLEAFARYEHYVTHEVK